MYNNDNFEKLKKRIDKCRNCYIQGPTGPKGEREILEIEEYKDLLL